MRGRALRDALQAHGGGHDVIDAAHAQARVQRHHVQLARHRAQRRIGAEAIDGPPLFLADHLPLTREGIATLATRDGVGQHMHRRQRRPVDVKVFREQHIARCGLHEALLVRLVREGFGGHHQRRAQHRCLRACGQHAAHVTAIGQPAGGGHRHVHAPEHLGKQPQQRLAAAHMPARLHALGDDGVRPGRLGVQGFVHRAHLMHHGDARRAQPVDHLLVDFPEEFDHRHAQGDAQIHLRAQQRARRTRRNQVHAKGPISEFAHPRHFAVDQCQRLAHHAQDAKTAEGADSGHQLGARHAAHAGQNQRMAATEKFTQRRGRERMRARHGNVLSKCLFRRPDHAARGRGTTQERSTCSSERLTCSRSSSCCSHRSRTSGASSLSSALAMSRLGA